MKFGSITLRNFMPRKKIDAWFKKETVSVGKVDQARSSESWEQLSIALEELCEARGSMYEAAKNGKRVQIIDSIELGDEITGGGRYLVRPPLVGKDAGILANTLHAKGVSGVVVCREPSTALGLCPIVALGSGVMARVQIEEPTNPEKPTCAWFDHAIEELGNHVLSKRNKEAPHTRQLDYLLAHIPAAPTHIGLYKAAIELCHTLESNCV
jgi:hypothetical protein